MSGTKIHIWAKITFFKTQLQRITEVAHMLKISDLIEQCNFVKDFL